MNTFIASIALIVAVIAAWFAHKQVVLIREERSRRGREEKELIEWSARATEVQQRLTVFMLRFSNGLNGAPSGPLYRSVIPDDNLRGLIETHLVRLDLGRNHVEARTLTPALLMLPIVREAITQVEKRFDEVRRNSHQLAVLSSLA